MMTLEEVKKAKKELEKEIQDKMWIYGVKPIASAIGIKRENLYRLGKQNTSFETLLNYREKIDKAEKNLKVKK